MTLVEKICKDYHVPLRARSIYSQVQKLKFHLGLALTLTLFRLKMTEIWTKLFLFSYLLFFEAVLMSNFSSSRLGFFFRWGKLLEKKQPLNTKQRNFRNDQKNRNENRIEIYFRHLILIFKWRDFNERKFFSGWDLTVCLVLSASKWFNFFKLRHRLA